MGILAKKTLYLNADKTEVVDEGSDDAAFLLVREGSEIDDATATQYKLTGDAPEVYDAVADHAAKHGGALLATTKGRPAAANKAKTITTENKTEPEA